MKQTYLQPKPRYEILDGLRGVAAMLVVVFHLFETYAPDHFHFKINHGYLAVDFFFVLSGFVIGYAYDDRWKRMSVGEFFKRRIVRLHPMLVVGTLFGALMFYFTGGEAFPTVDSTPWWLLLLTTVFCCTLLPLWPGADIRGWSETNPLNGPAWSLQYEYAGNILYALFFRRCRRRTLEVWVALFAVLTVMLTMRIDPLGLMADRDWVAYTVIGGWSLLPVHLIAGASRLLYPFFGGLLLYRMGRRIRLGRHGFAWCSAALLTLFCMPYVGTEECQWPNGLYECICILVLFPAIVAAGAGSSTGGRRTTAACRFLGELSYPLYITHYPLIYMQLSWAKAHPDLPQSTHTAVMCATFVLCIATAYGCMKLIDTPVRRLLTERWLRSGTPDGSTTRQKAG